ncbi:hypothetical protein RI367_005235 [Sorochytrium milnesiophthora]
MKDSHAVAVGLTALAAIALYRRSSSAAGDAVDVNDDTLYIYHFGRPLPSLMPGMPSNASPLLTRRVASSGFCLKLETYLRMTNTAYQVREDPQCQSAPKGQLPYILHRGRKIGDSQLIVHYLENSGVTQPLGLEDEKHAALVEPFRIMVETVLYQAIIYTRWAADENQDTNARNFFYVFSPLMRVLVGVYFRGYQMRKLKATGMGRHTRQEVVVLGTACVDSVAQQLGDKEYLFGSGPSVADASLYGVLKVASLPRYPWDPIGDAVRSHPNLTRYLDRITKEYFPEFCAPM